MKTGFFRHLLSFAAALCCMGSPLHGTENAESVWNIVSVEGVEYYSAYHLRNFYKLTPPEKKKKSDSLVIRNSAFSLTLTPGQREMILGGYRCRLSHPVRKQEDGELLISKTDFVKLIDPILRPTYIPERREIKTVIIDPGHGGTDEGNKSPLYKESAYTLQLAQELATALQKQGLNTVLTRKSQINVSDIDRVELAKKHRHAIFVSLHLNSGRSEIHGVETYTAAPVEPGGKATEASRHDSANAALAFALHSHLVSATKAPDRACRRAHYSFLNTMSCPAVMLMPGYITHAEESVRLQSDEYRATLVQAMTDGILAFKAAMAPGANILPPPAPKAEAPAAPVPVQAPTPSPEPTPKTNSGNKKSTQKSTQRRSSGRRSGR